jgi:hypothetical protein
MPQNVLSSDPAEGRSLSMAAGRYCRRHYVRTTVAYVLTKSVGGIQTDAFSKLRSRDLSVSRAEL